MVTPASAWRDTLGMRIAIAATVLFLTAACGSTPSATSPASTPPPPSPPVSSAAAMKIYTWGESATSTDVLIKLDAPVSSTEPVIGSNGKPDPKFKMIVLPITATNNASGQATVAVRARIGQQEAGVYEDEGGKGKWLPGESGQVRRPLRIPADATGDLTIEVYANIDQQPTKNRLAFKGPLPS